MRYRIHFLPHLEGVSSGCQVKMGHSLLPASGGCRQVPTAQSCLTQPAGYLCSQGQSPAWKIKKCPSLLRMLHYRGSLCFLHRWPVQILAVTTVLREVYWDHLHPRNSEPEGNRKENHSKFKRKNDLIQ